MHRMRGIQIQIQLQDIDAGLAEESELAAFGVFGDEGATSASVRPRSRATRAT